jgi:hypothetical protein
MKSPTLALLEEAGVPPTRENFLNLAFMGNAPNRLDAEEEAQLPRPLRDAHRENDRAIFDRSTKKIEQAAQEKAAEKTITPDITIGGGEKGTEQQKDQKFMREQKMLDQLDDQQYGEQRKSNLI